MNDTRTPKSPCPICGYVMDAATMVNGSAGPKPGDVSICMRCGAVNLFGEDLTIRAPTADEKTAIMASENWRLIQRTVFLVRTKRGLK